MDDIRYCYELKNRVNQTSGPCVMCLCVQGENRRVVYISQLDKPNKRSMCKLNYFSEARVIICVGDGTGSDTEVAFELDRQCVGCSGQVK